MSPPNFLQLSLAWNQHQFVFQSQPSSPAWWDGAKVSSSTTPCHLAVLGVKYFPLIFHRNSFTNTRKWAIHWFIGYGAEIQLFEVVVKLGTYLNTLLKAVFSMTSGLKPAVRSRPTVNLKAHQESESNFQSTWKHIWICPMNQQTAGHDRKSHFVFAQSCCVDQEKVESTEFTVYTTSGKVAHSGWLRCS